MPNLESKGEADTKKAIETGLVEFAAPELAVVPALALICPSRDHSQPAHLAHAFGARMGKPRRALCGRSRSVAAPLAVVCDRVQLFRVRPTHSCQKRRFTLIMPTQWRRS